MTEDLSTGGIDREGASYLVQVHCFNFDGNLKKQHFSSIRIDKCIYKS